MKHNRFHQIISVAMAMLVFISTLSVSIEKHYCGEHLVDVAIFTEAESCGMEVSDKLIETSDEGKIIKKNMCCTDVVDLIEGQDELSLEQTIDLNTYQKVFIFSFAYAFSGSETLELQNETPFEHYTPPIVVKDIQVLNEAFLI